jgi:lipoprotein-anchoring transpeptidase ErfK/SrfK
MDNNQYSEERRERPATTAERRNYTPGGRLRRILFDHRSSVWLSLGAVVLLLLLFVGTTAFAVNERFERDVAQIAYSRDSKALQFLLDKESAEIQALSDTVAALESRAGQPAGENRPYLVVSLEEKRVWYLQGEDTLFTAPVAVGSGKTIVMGGKTQRFQTPRGQMTITRKERDPIWVPPDWHYHRIAQERGLRVVNMSNAAPNALEGFPAGKEPIADGVIYIPPYGSPQRRYTGVLGAAKLEMRDGYYFHGTNNEASVGTAASSGCLRMLRDDILWMYDNVPVGTEVYIY